MRIAIDARAYDWAGVGRYTRNLLAALATIDSENEYIVLIGDKKNDQEIKGLSGGSQFETVLVESSYYSWREQLIFLGQLNAIKADIFHFTHFNVPLMFNRPYVVTIHDVTRFIYPGQRQQGLAKQLVYERVFSHAVTRSKALICVSDYTRQALEVLPIKRPDNIKTIYEGVDDRFLQSVKQGDRDRARMLVGTTDPYLLYAGVWMGHKNLSRILKAYKLLLKSRPNLKLVLTGKPKPGYVPVDKIARQLGLSSDQVLFLGFVPNELLPALYAESVCLLFPSLYEGFGLPALEAASSGTSLVVSNVSSFPELLGRSESSPTARFVNPESVEGIARGVESVMADNSFRGELVKNGSRLARSYSWEDCAEETLGVYNSWVR